MNNFLALRANEKKRGISIDFIIYNFGMCIPYTFQFIYVFMIGHKREFYVT